VLTILDCRLITVERYCHTSAGIKNKKMNGIVVIKSQCFHLPVEIKRLDQNIPSIFRLLLCVNKLQNISIAEKNVQKTASIVEKQKLFFSVFKQEIKCGLYSLDC
jgi:hypothetical protein